MAVGSNGFRKKWVNSWNNFIQLVVFFLKKSICYFRGSNKNVSNGLSAKRREPRRHTLQNGIDQSMVNILVVTCVLL
jgi:hypothetical protein